MPKIKQRAYSLYSRQAVSLLGKLIHLYRTERKLSVQDLTDRAGISRTTLWKIEQGDMKCEIGIVFELAALVGIPLFDLDSQTIGTLEGRIEDKIALLPKSVRSPKREVKDDF